MTPSLHLPPPPPTYPPPPPISTSSSSPSASLMGDTTPTSVSPSSTISRRRKKRRTPVIPPPPPVPPRRSSSIVFQQDSMYSTNGTNVMEAIPEVSPLDSPPSTIDVSFESALSRDHHLNDGVDSIVCGDEEDQSEAGHLTAFATPASSLHGHVQVQGERPEEALSPPPPPAEEAPVGREPLISPNLAALDDELTQDTNADSPDTVVESPEMPVRCLDRPEKPILMLTLSSDHADDEEAFVPNLPRPSSIARSTVPEPVSPRTRSREQQPWNRLEDSSVSSSSPPQTPKSSLATLPLDLTDTVPLYMRPDATEMDWAELFWVVITDPSSGHTFFYNPCSTECKWSVPPGTFVLPRNPEGNWLEFYDAAHKRPYYYHSSTRQCQWDKPRSLVIPVHRLSRRASATVVGSSDDTEVGQMSEASGKDRKASPAALRKSVSLEARPQRRAASEVAVKEQNKDFPRSRARSMHDLKTEKVPKKHRPPKLDPNLIAPRGRTASLGPMTATFLRPRTNSSGSSDGYLPKSRVSPIQSPRQAHPQRRPIAAGGSPLDSIQELTTPSSSSAGRHTKTPPSTTRNWLGRDRLSVLPEALPSPSILAREASLPCPHPGFRLSGTASFASFDVATLSTCHDVRLESPRRPLFPAEPSLRSAEVADELTHKLSTGRLPIVPMSMQSSLHHFSDFIRSQWGCNESSSPQKKKDPLALLSWHRNPPSSSILPLEGAGLRKEASYCFKIIIRLCEERTKPVFTPRPPLISISYVNGEAEVSTADPRAFKGAKVKQGSYKPVCLTMPGINGSSEGASVWEEQKWLLEICTLKPAVRDEVICQLVTRLNRDAPSISRFRAWQFLGVLLTSIVPTDKKLLGALAAFIDDVSYAESEHQCIRLLAQYCRDRMNTRMKQGPDYVPKLPSPIEIQAAWEAAFNPVVFERSLVSIVSRQQQTEEYADLEIPLILPFLVEGLMLHDALNAQGIFRLQGSQDRQVDLRLRLDRGQYTWQNVSLASDSLVIASVFKTFLSALEESVLPSKLYLECLQAASDDDFPQCARLIASPKMPPVNRKVLLFVIAVLQKFSEPAVAEVTTVFSKDLARLFGPILLRSPSMDPVTMALNETFEARFVHLLLVQLDCFSFDADYSPEEDLKMLPEHTGPSDASVVGKGRRGSMVR